MDCVGSEFLQATCQFTSTRSHVSDPFNIIGKQCVPLKREILLVMHM